MRYSLKKKKETSELHLFRAPMNGTNCQPEKSSICNKMKLSDRVADEFVCKTESIARIKCATLGRQVCGTCVSHLYADY